MWESWMPKTGVLEHMVRIFVENAKEVAVQLGLE